ncbi:MAG TPA: hypothetical protein VKO85_12960 [Wenzhouxiangellaceae bacterium]|nr:hypothetical protein [Wenzhouxiangellaceae bacterium]
MTEQRNDKHDAALEALYREAGDVEPDAGLDRIIRARADEAVRNGRSSNRLPWLGGLVTASVAVVAIAVVLQQTPPAGPVPSITAPPSEDAGAFMAPSVGAEARLESESRETRPVLDEIRKMQSSSEAAEAEPSPSASALNARGRSLNRATQAVEQRNTRQSPMEKSQDNVAEKDSLGDEQSENAAEPARSPVAEIAENPELMLARIEMLIANEEIQRARDLLEAFRQKYPEYTIPKKIRETVAPE